MQNIRDPVLRKFEAWTKKNPSVSDFDIISQAPFVKKTSSSNEKKSTKDYMIMFNQKIAKYFEKCETLKTGFIKNRKFKNIKIILKDSSKFDLVLHKEKLLFSKCSDLNEKLDLVNSLEFSLILYSHPSNHSLLGWFISSSQFYYVYEYLNITLDYYLSSDLSAETLKNLLVSFINAYKFYSEKQLLMDNFELFIKNSELIFAFPKKIESSKPNTSEAEKSKLIEIVNKLNINNWMKIDEYMFTSMDKQRVLECLSKISN